MDHTGPGGTIATFDYTLDPAGNRVGVDTHAGSETYVLDELNRITEATYADGTTESFGYDPAGNRTTRTGADGTTTYTYDPAGQLVSSSGPDGDLTFTHDSVGRLTAISDGTTYAYNTAGQLTQATIDGTTHTYSYDADGIRVDVDGQPQLWDRNGPLPMLVHDGDTHTWGPDGQLLTTGDAWAHADALGSIRVHTNTTGDLTATVDYHAFGTPTSAWDSFGYTAGIHDPTGHIHLRARNHHPGLGRFTTRDPIQPGAPGTGGYNHYTYVANNPTTWTDPTGMVVDNALLRQGVSTQTLPRVGLVGAGVFAVLEQLAYCLAGIVSGWCIYEIEMDDPWGGPGTGGSGAGSGGGPDTAAPGVPDPEDPSGLPEEIVRRVEANLTGSGETVLGHYSDDYIGLAQQRGASYFDIGDAWGGLSEAQRWAANQLVLDAAIANRDRVTLATARPNIRYPSALADEIGYLTSPSGGYIWVDDVTLVPG